jgi:DNA-binding transcriptional MerR regulator
VEQVGLPNKLYFRIGEVAKIVGVKPYVLRYWETEFAVLKPGKTPSHHRLYRRRDVETLLEIKHLLYEEGFTIAGAKKKLKESEKDSAVTASAASPHEEKDSALPSVSTSSSRKEHPEYRRVLQTIRDDLRELYQFLSEKPL